MFPNALFYDTDDSKIESDLDFSLDNLQYVMVTWLCAVGNAVFVLWDNRARM